EGGRGRGHDRRFARRLGCIGHESSTEPRRHIEPRRLEGTKGFGVPLMEEAVIVSAVRTAVGKAPNGTLRGTRPDELAATAITEALRRAPAIDRSDIDDVILG